MNESKQATPTVTAVGEMNLTGNVIPTNWYINLKRESGKPHTTAVILLSEIVYWHRPTVIKDEATGQVVEIRRKFKADKLQRSYASFAEQFGFTKRQVKDALKFLAEKGIIELEFRHFTAESGVPLSNVLFIGLDAVELARITHQRPAPSEKVEDGLHSNGTHLTKECKTYTETTAENTTEHVASATTDEILPEETPEETPPEEELTGQALVDASFGKKKPAEMPPHTHYLEQAKEPWTQWGAESQEFQRLLQQYGARGRKVQWAGYELDKRFGLRPVWSSKKKVKSWCSGLYECLQETEGNKEMVLQAARELREAGMTISDPYSLVKKCRALMAEARSQPQGMRLQV